MGDLSAPPLAAATLSGELVPNISSRSSTPPAGSDKALTQSLPSNTVNSQPQLGSGSAMFSTDLGMRAPRKLQGPPYPPILVRSDLVEGIFMAAGVWRNKYPYQYLCIFPHSGWQIGDLWDEEDIHLETESFCKDLLQFIERDVCVRAQNYAQQWSRIHADRLHIVGGDMTDLYDRHDHISIVNKVFVNGEQQEYPPIFLWHVAHIMRTAMLAVKGVKLPARHTYSVSQRLGTGQDGPVSNNTIRVPAIIEGTGTSPTASSERTYSSTYVAKPPPSMAVPQYIPAHRKDRQSPRAPYHGPPYIVGRYNEPMKHIMAGNPGNQMGSPNLVPSNLHVAKNRPARSASGMFNRSMPPGPYSENTPRVPSGSYSCPQVGLMPMTQSPRIHQQHMTMNHSMVNLPHGMAPVVYEQNPMVPGMIAGPQLHPGIIHPSMMPLHSAQNTSLTQGHPRQPSGSQGPPYAVPLTDLTNMNYPTGMSPHHIDPRRPGERRYSLQHGNGSALYDPYEGNNPAFRASKKHIQNGFQNSNSRQRKGSMPGNRSYHNQYTNDKPSQVQQSGHRILGPKDATEDDPAITHDHEYGCHFNWIGPQNTTVTEVFIRDLPEDIQDAELVALFQDRIGARPKSIITRHSFQPHENYLGRKHAFVGFLTTAVARQAISIRDPTIRGLSVSVTVPKRFFQKIAEFPGRGTNEAGLSNSRFVSHANNREARNIGASINEGRVVTMSTETTQDDLSYSPQDARSDLHKVKKGKQPQQGSTAVGSPEKRKFKSKKRQESSQKDVLMETTQGVQGDVVHGVANVEAPISGTVKTMPSVDERHTEQPQGIAESSSRPEVLVSPTAAAKADAAALHKTQTDSISSTSKPHRAARQQEESQPNQAVEKVDPDESMQIPVKVPTEAKDGKVSLPDALEPRHLASDGELGNNARLYSAVNSQLDPDLKTEPGADSDLANQGTAIASPKPTETLTSEDRPPVSDTTPRNFVTNNATEHEITSAVAGDKPSTPDPTPPTMPSAGKLQEIKLSPASPNTAESAKRNGAHYTESLHPFSKASRAQAKKEREQKRKAQKKEKEQAEKARAAKILATKPSLKSEPIEKEESSKEKVIAVKMGTTDKAVITLQSKSAKKDSTPSGNKRCPAPTQGDIRPKSPIKKTIVVAKTTKGTVDGRDKQGKRKGKQAATTTASSELTAENKNDDHGKQIGGDISIPNKTGSVTKKEVKFYLPTDEPDADAQSSKQEDHSAAAIAESGSTKSAKKRKPKKKKLCRVWPSLEFRPRSPNPAWMGAIDMETDPHNYDNIMNTACGEDDSDFSWDDIPAHTSSEEEKYSSASDDGGDGGRDGHLDKDSAETPKRMQSFETQQAAHALLSLNGMINGMSEQKRALGDALYPKIHKMQPGFAGKITLLILELDDSELIDLTRNESSLRAKVDEAMTIYNEHIQNMNHESEEETTVKSEDPKLSALSEDNEEVVERFSAALNAQIAGKHEELDAATRGSCQHVDTPTLSDVAAPGSQSAKKKKPNNRKNKKKKKQQPDTAADFAGPAETPENGDVNETTEAETPFVPHSTDDPIDTDDPFYDQLKGIEAIKRGEPVADTQDPQYSQPHADIAKSVADSEFMRTMEGYFKETQGPSQPRKKGRTILKEDIL